VRDLMTPAHCLRRMRYVGRSVKHGRTVYDKATGVFIMSAE
jgi:hypothetical protein